MTDFILSVILTSFWIHGVHRLFSPGYLLGEWGDHMEEQLPNWLMKPLFGCPVCMASIHGAFWFGVVLPFGFDISFPLLTAIPFMVCVCGLNSIIHEFKHEE